MLGSAQIPAIVLDGNQTQELIAPVQDTLIASKAYAIGDYFIFNGGMYKVTTAIAQGGSIIIGTVSGCNAITSDTVMEDFNEWKNASCNHFIKAFPSTMSIAIPFAKSHYVMYMGLVGNVGDKMLSVYVNSSGVVTVKDIYTGNTFTNANLSVTFNDNTLTFTFSYYTYGILISDGIKIN